MNAQQLGLVGLVLLVLGIAGCTTTPKVDFEVDPDLDPARYQSYYMLPIPTKFSSGIACRIWSKPLLRWPNNRWMR